MPLFKRKNSKLLPIKEKPFALEKELQILTEENLGEIFGLELISSEFALQSLRIDTLAFNLETKSFVIIEYKREQGFTVVDQGFTYLSLLLNNQAEFVLEYNMHMRTNLQKKDFDWSQTRIIFLSRSFTTYQQGAINFRDLPIELWEVKRYSNSSILYEQIKAGGGSASVNTFSASKKIQRVSKEV